MNYGYLAGYMGDEVDEEQANEFGSYLTERGFDVPDDETTFVNHGILDQSQQRVSLDAFYHLIDEWALENGEV